MITRADKMLIASLIILAVISMPLTIFSLRAQGTATEVIILSGGKELAHEPLGERKEIKVEGPLGTTVVQIQSGRVRVVSSPCPQHICLAQGWISRSGEVIVCAPNRVAVKLSGQSDLDVLSR